MRHKGRKAPATSATIPSSTTPREASDSGRSRNRFDERSMACMAKAPDPLWLDGEIALHLLMQRRAEVRAVERVDAGLVRLEPDRLGLARVDHDVHVVLGDAEP